MRLIFFIDFLIFFSTNLLAQSNHDHLKISRLKDDFYIFETYNYYKGERISANAMYVVTDSGVVLFDTPWDSTQFQPLLDTIKKRHNKNAVLCIATHFHGDRTGGLEFYRQQNIKTFTTALTDELSKKKNMKRAEYLMQQDTVFHVGQYSFVTFYPGKGHAPDNIVVWFEKEKILYGGCLIKSAKDKDLGNLSDASIPDYAATLKKVQQKFSKPKYIITGHGDYKNKRSLKHTFKMAERMAAGEQTKK
jgi:metallo-beta-lactamase class B